MATPTPEAVPPVPEPPLVDAQMTLAPVVPVYAPEIAAIVCAPQYTWRCEDAVSVVLCESGGDASAWNDWSLTADPYDGVAGWFQIAIPLHAALIAVFGSVWDAAANTAAAFQLWLDSGGSWYPHWAAACRP